MSVRESGGDIALELLRAPVSRLEDPSFAHRIVHDSLRATLLFQTVDGGCGLGGNLFIFRRLSCEIA